MARCCARVAGAGPKSSHNRDAGPKSSHNRAAYTIFLYGTRDRCGHYLCEWRLETAVFLFYFLFLVKLNMPGVLIGILHVWRVDI